MTVEYPTGRVPADGAVPRGQRIALVDLLDRLLAGGVVLTGDLTLSIADVDLVKISLRVLISSVSGQNVLEPGEPAEPVELWDTGREPMELHRHDRTGT